MIYVTVIFNMYAIINYLLLLACAQWLMSLSWLPLQVLGIKVTYHMLWYYDDDFLQLECNVKITPVLVSGDECMQQWHLEFLLQAKWPHLLVNWLVWCYILSSGSRPGSKGHWCHSHTLFKAQQTIATLCTNTRSFTLHCPSTLTLTLYIVCQKPVLPLS